MNDEKRRKIQVGDLTEFVKVPEKDETLIVEITGLKSFETYEIYTPEQEKQWRALAITIKYVSHE